MTEYDAVLLVSFGGPETPDEVMPFLENVTRGRGVPRERLLGVAEHYHHFGGRSPINDQNRALKAALERELETHGPKLPVYWGNRNWHPLLAATIGQMKQDGIRRAVAFVTSAFSSYSGCRQYQENIARACAEVGEGAPEIDKLRVFSDHPAFLEVIRQEAFDALHELPPERRHEAYFLFTAHSIPTAMADTCRYAEQLQQASAAVARLLRRDRYRLVYQSRSGAPTQPWLEPDVLDAIRELHQQGVRSLVIVPIGFVSDHIEILYDLDTEARALCEEAGIVMARAATTGTHPYFVRMIRELIVERMEGGGVIPGLCTPDCCPALRPVRG
ncbi:MAG TPA: ferrochelatase [Bryobacteraceae bacterium]|nr:ferrochelatase [Bryobacteraceae bacterium]